MENTTTKAIKFQRNYTITVSVLAAISFVVLTVLAALVLLGMNNNSSDMLKATRAASEDDVQTIKAGMTAIAAGLAAIGFIGAGMGQGYAAGKAAEAVGRNPEAEGKIRNMMFIGAAVAESSALYALVISIMCLFVA